MANFTPQKIDLSQINNGQKYENGDGINSQAINAPIEASAYAQELSETTQNNFQQLETSTNSFMQSTQQDVTSFKEQINTEISSINAEVETFKSDTNDNINSFKTQVNQNIDSFKSEVNNEIADLENQITQEQGTKVTIGGVLQSNLELNTATVGKSETALNSNNNLVLNGDFSYQGDGTSFSQTGVTYNNFGFRGANVTFNESGVSLVANSSDICGIYSIIPDGYKQSGKTVTLSVGVGQTTDPLTIAVVVNSSTDISVVTAVGTKTTSTSGIVTTTVTLPTLTQTGRELKVFAWIQSPTANTSSFSLEYIKLEEGSVSTAPNNLVTNATNALLADNATNATNATNAEKSNALNTTLYSDLNNATEGGTLFYGNTSSSNQNTANTSAFAGQVLQGGTVASLDYLAQKAIHYGGAIAGVDSTVTREYVRGKIGNLWQNWQEVPSLVKDWESSDGLSWYRIWSNGLKECGGTLTTNGTSTPLTVALPVTYKDTTYKTLITPKNLNNTASPTTVKIIKDSITTNSFNVVGCYATATTQGYSDIQFDYYCRGK